MSECHFKTASHQPAALIEIEARGDYE